MPFALDWRFEGPSAPYFLAIDNGYFADEGLSVEVTAGQGSLDAIPKVASGAFPGFDGLGIEPKPLDLFLDRWMVRYRKHGRFHAESAV